MGANDKTTGNATGKTDKKNTGGTTFDLAAAMKAYQASGQGGAVAGAVFTPAEGDRAVQTVYQQLLGRNASGNDYAKAYSIAMSQSKDTSIYGRQQAVMNAVMQSPEFQTRQDNKYLDAIYNAIAADVRRTRQ
jgi:hypothetical protein